MQVLFTIQPGAQHASIISAVTRARLVGCDLKFWSSLSSFLESYRRKLVTA